MSRSRAMALGAAACLVTGCGMSAEDARMLLAGTRAAALTTKMQRLELIAITCARLEACARGCEPVFEGMSQSVGAEKMVLLRRCPDVARVVPEAAGPAQEEAARKFFLERLSGLAPQAKRKLSAAEVKLLDCSLGALADLTGGGAC